MSLMGPRRPGLDKMIAGVEAQLESNQKPSLSIIQFPKVNVKPPQKFRDLQRHYRNLLAHTEVRRPCL